MKQENPPHPQQLASSLVPASQSKHSKDNGYIGIQQPMDEQWYEELEQLIKQACAAPAKSEIRSQLTDRIIRKLQRQGILPAPTWAKRELYHEAWSKTWLNFSLNLCECNTLGTKTSYCSQTVQVIVWRLRKYCYYRIRDLKVQDWKERQQAGQRRDGDGNLLEIEEWLAAPSDDPHILDELVEWIQADASEILRRTHVRNQPQVHAQIVLLRRLFDKVSWEVLSNELNTPLGTLTRFLEDRCLPLLETFAIEKGYREPMPEILVPLESLNSQVLADWLNNDPTGILRNTHLKNRPDVTAQLVLLRKFNSQDTLKEALQALAQEYGIEFSRLSSFYYRDCKPLIKQFGNNGGYLGNQGGDQ